MADETSKFIDIEGLSHFKAKQDLEYAGKFKSKDESTDLKGAVRYDVPQILTEEQKAQARLNLGLSADGGGTGGGSVVVKDEIIVITATLNETDEAITITEDAADIITNYTGEKPMYLRLDPLGLFFRYITTENCFLCCLSEGHYQKITTDAENLVCHLEKIEPTHYSSGTTIGSYTLNADGTYVPIDAEKDSGFPSGIWVSKFVFVSDKVYTVEELIGTTIKTKEIYLGNDDRVYDKFEDIEITSDSIMEIGNGTFAVMSDEFPVLAVITESMKGVEIAEGFSLPTYAGTYLAYADKNPERQGFVFGSVKASNEKIKKLDEKYIPDVFARKDEVPTLDHYGKIPPSLLPSFVDDVVEGYYAFGYDDQFYNAPDYTINSASKLIPAEPGKIYVDFNTGNIYRWAGSQYVRINPDEYTVATNADIDALFE